MGVEENVTQVASQSVDALRERPLMFGMLLMVGVFLAFNAWQQHDSNDQNRLLVLKLLEFRHNELMVLLQHINETSNGTSRPPPVIYEPSGGVK